MTLMRCQEKYRFSEKTDLCKFEALSRVQPDCFYRHAAHWFRPMPAEQTVREQPERTGMTASV